MKSKSMSSSLQFFRRMFWSGLLLVGPASLAHAERWQMSSTLYFGGLRIAQAQTVIDIAPDMYHMYIKVVPDGAAKAFGKRDLTVDVAGRHENRENFRPLEYDLVYMTRKENRLIQMLFPADAHAELPPTKILVEPPPQNREKVPESMLGGVRDPVSAALHLSFLFSRTGSCAHRVAAFDGKRRYDIVAQNDGETTLLPSRLSVHEGPAHICRVTLQRLAGYREDEKKHPPLVGKVWMQHLQEEGFWLPVRLQVPSRAGVFVWHAGRLQNASR